MKKEFLELGKIVGTHSLDGSMRVQPWCDNAEFVKQFKEVYVGKEKLEAKIEKYIDKNTIYIIKLDLANSIDEAQKYKNRIIFIKRDDAVIDDNSYFIQELIGCKVIDFDDESRQYGVLSDVYETGANDVWCIKADKDYLIPVITDVVKSVDIENEIIKISPLKGIFDEEVNGDED